MILTIFYSSKTQSIKTCSCALREAFEFIRMEEECGELQSQTEVLNQAVPATSLGLIALPPFIWWRSFWINRFCFLCSKTFLPLACYEFSFWNFFAVGDFKNYLCVCGC